MDQPIIESSGRPLSYELLILNQLERIAAEILDVDKTIKNIDVLDAYTIIDQDDRYDSEIKELDDQFKKEKNEAFDIVTKKPNREQVIGLKYKISIEKLKPIMRCLKRAGRFPAKYGLLDEAGWKVKGEVEESDNDLPHASRDGVEKDSTE